MNLTLKNYHLKPKPAFTLVEMLLVMGIMSILLVILTQVFASILSLRMRSVATTAVAQDSRYLISRLSYDVIRPQYIVAPLPGSSDNALVLTIDGNTFTYALQGDALTLSVNAASPERLTDIYTAITGATFTRNSDMGDKKSINIVLNIESKIIVPGGVSGARQLTTTLATR